MPHLIVLRGPIGAGKTSVMHSLSKKFINVSVIEVDALKRMLDPHASSSWRRKAAFSTALFIAKQALSCNRDVIVETHSKEPRQQHYFKDLVHKTPGSTYKSILITAPLSVCIKRSQKRFVPGINYTIDITMVKAYYAGLEPLSNELVVDTSKVSAQLGAQLIFDSLFKKEV